MFKPKKIIVVGGNAAGPSAAAKAKRLSPESEVLLFEAGDFISTGTCELPYVLSEEIKDYKEIIYFDPVSFQKEKGVKVYINHRVERVDRKNKQIVVSNGNSGELLEYVYDSLVLCTGSSAKKISTLQPGLKNIFALKSVSDLLDILSYLHSSKPENCLILGSGYIGLETSDALHKRGIKVTLADVAPCPFPGSEPETQHFISELLKSRMINFIPNASEIKYYYDGDRVIKYKHDGRLSSLDFIIVAAGVIPNSRLALESKLELGSYNGIKVDRKLKTSDPNIYAAGDNIEVINAVTGKPGYIPQATLAHLHGHIAGANAAGGNEFVNRVVKNIAFKIFGKSISQVGLTYQEAKEYFYNVDCVSAAVPNLVKVMPGSASTFGKLIYRKNDLKILGATFIGDKEVVGNADIIATMITADITVDRLNRINFNYTPPLSPFINILSILGRKIRR